MRMVLFLNVSLNLKNMIYHNNKCNLCVVGVGPGRPVRHRAGDPSVPGSAPRHGTPANVLLLQRSKRHQVCVFAFNFSLHTF